MMLLLLVESALIAKMITMFSYMNKPQQHISFPGKYIYVKGTVGIFSTGGLAPL